MVPFTWHTKGFMCFYCLKPMKDCEVLKEHTLKHSIDLEVFIPKRIISKDVPIKIDISGLGCKVCSDAQLKDLEDLISHIVYVHNEEYDTNFGVCVFPFVLSKDWMQCVLCHNRYDNFTSMIWHMYRDHVSHSWVCQICGLSFISRVRLNRHISNSHVGYRCSVCGKMFNAFHRLEKHKQQMHGQTKSYECNLCSAKFDNSYQVKVHLGKTHNVEQYRIKCDHCTKICTTKGAMLLHVQSQHSDLKYECDTCDYKAGIKWLITLHKRKHYEEKDYSCSICERPFRRSSNLRTHMKVHSGVAGRVCRFCRRGFTDFGTLKKHEAELHYREDT